MEKYKMKNIIRKYANIAALSAAFLPYAVGASAFADDEVIVKKQSDLEAAIDSVPKEEATVWTPVSLLNRGFLDGHGNYQSHHILQNGFGKLALRNESGANVYGADLNMGKLSNGYLDGLRF